MARRSASLLVLGVGTLALSSIYAYTRTYAPAQHCGDDRAFLPERGTLARDAATRFPGTTPPPCSRNRHGEQERIGAVQVTHWFVEAGGITWHFVTAGEDWSVARDRAVKEPVVLLHGFPESWWAFHPQIEALARAGYPTIAIDVIPYGQSDKRLELDYRYPAIAAAVLALLDRIGVQRFHLVTHDRGSVIGDHLVGEAEVGARVMRYVRMQQTADRTRTERVPPHRLMGSPAGTMLYKSRRFPGIVYTGEMVSRRLTGPTILRLDYEFKYKGIAEAAPLSFRTTSSDQELIDRRERLFAKMTMPVLFLQGRLDPGQPPEEFFRVDEAVSQGRLQFIEAGHFLHLEAPELVNAAVLGFLAGDHAAK